jgi:hypothetical protein
VKERVEEKSYGLKGKRLKKKEKKKSISFQSLEIQFLFAYKCNVNQIAANLSK